MNLFKLGKITAPVGIKGEMRVYSYLNESARFSNIKKIILDGKELAVEHAREQKGMFVVKLEGIDDRNTSELMRGKELFVEKDKLDLGKDTYYVDDLTGCDVVDEDGKKVGVLVRVLNNPAHDLYEIETEEGKSFLIPAVHEFILGVEAENRLIRVHLIEGMIS